MTQNGIKTANKTKVSGCPDDVMVPLYGRWRGDE
jgi:hypothetical protein